MFDLAEYIKENYGGRREPEARQRLIQQPQNPLPAELADPVDPMVGIQQPNLQPNNAQNNNAQQQDRKINPTAAVLLVILYVIPISLVVYGAVHIKDCPAQNMIAISLIVLGALSLLSRILSSPQECRTVFNINDDAPRQLCLVCLNLVVQLVIFGFFLAICYWIFSIKPDTKPEQEDSPNYCEKAFYNDTYYGCIVGLVFFGLAFTGICCGVYIMICSIIAGGVDD